VPRFEACEESEARGEPPLPLSGYPFPSLLAVVRFVVVVLAAVRGLNGFVEAFRGLRDRLGLGRGCAAAGISGDKGLLRADLPRFRCERLVRSR
jgi:hypothetical protein